VQDDRDPVRAAQVRVADRPDVVGGQRPDAEEHDGRGLGIVTVSQRAPFQCRTIARAVPPNWLVLPHPTAHTVFGSDGTRQLRSHYGFLKASDDSQRERHSGPEDTRAPDVILTK
jgi:hypothetical protein